MCWSLKGYYSLMYLFFERYEKKTIVLIQGYQSKDVKYVFKSQVWFAHQVFQLVNI